MNDYFEEQGDLKLLEILLSKDDYKFITYLKNASVVTENELRQLGEILINSLRGFC